MSEQLDALKRLEEEFPNPLKAAEPEEPSTFVDLTRATVQGLSFGFGEEIEAAVRAALDSDAEYADVVAEIRNQINDHRKRNPAVAFGAEIAGSVLPVVLAQFIPGLGQAAGAGRVAQIGAAISKSPVARAALTSGAQGTLYGAGVAEGGLGSRAKSAAQTGVLSAGLGAGLQKVAPHITAKAKSLIAKGIPVTPGQAVRGSNVIGDTLATLEEKTASTLPFIGDAIKHAFDRTRSAFNRASLNEALGPIGVRAPKGVEGRELMRFGQKQLAKAYDDVLAGMKLADQDPFYQGVLKVVENANKDIQDDILDRAERLIFARFDDAVGGVLRGDALKKVQSFLRKDLKRLRDAGFGDETAARKADAIEDILAVFSHQLAKENPKLARRLNNVDMAYGNFEIVRNASIRRKSTAGKFTPGDLLGAAFKGDPTSRGSQFSGGTARMQPLAETAQDVIGKTIADSGTAGRMEAVRLAQSILAGTGVGYSALGGVVDPTIGIPLIAGGAAAYSPAGVPIARGVARAAGAALKQAVPVGSARATQGDIPENVRQMLARALQRKTVRSQARPGSQYWYGQFRGGR
jgi:hypothetical protein